MQMDTMNGILMDQRTGKPVKVNGEIVTASRIVTPAKKDDAVELEFIFQWCRPHRRYSSRL